MPSVPEANPPTPTRSVVGGAPDARSPPGERHAAGRKTASAATAALAKSPRASGIVLFLGAHRRLVDEALAVAGGLLGGCVLQDGDLHCSLLSRCAGRFMR